MLHVLEYCSLGSTVRSNLSELKRSRHQEFRPELELAMPFLIAKYCCQVQYCLFKLFTEIFFEVLEHDTMLAGW